MVLVKLKRAAAIFAFLICLFGLSNTVLAANDREVLVDQYKIEYADGSYVVVSTYQELSYLRADVRHGYKDYSYYDGGLAWVFTVHGDFSYTGTSATCYNATYTYNIYDNSWFCTSASAWPSGNAAFASASMCCGRNDNIVNPSLALYCSADGTIS